MTNKITDLEQPSLHHMLSGEIIDYIVADDVFLLIRTKSGREVKVAWVNSDTGEPIKGKPALAYAGLRVIVESAGALFSKG